MDKSTIWGVFSTIITFLTIIVQILQLEDLSLFFSLSIMAIILIFSNIAIAKLTILRYDKEKGAILFSLIGLITQSIITWIYFAMYPDAEIYDLPYIYAVLAGGMLYLISVINFSIIQDDPNRSKIVK